MKIKYKIIDKRIGTSFAYPNAASEGSAGIDLIACLEEELIILPNDKHLIPTGIAISLPDNNMVALIFPRSGLSHKHGLMLGNGVGVIDSDYRGQIFVSLWNSSQKPYSITPGNRIAQLVIMPIVFPILEPVMILDDTERGEGGFGSSGH